MSARATLRRERDGMWSACVPSLPGCMTWAATPADAQSHLRLAADLYVKALRRRGLAVPATHETTRVR